MTAKKDIEKQLDDFFKSEEFFKLKNTAANLFEMSVGMLNDFVENANMKRKEKLPAVKNEDIVNKNVKSSTFYRVLSVILTILLWVNIVIAFFTLTGYFISGNSAVLRAVLGFFIPVIAIIYFGNYYCKIKINQLMRYKKYLKTFGNDSVATVENLALSANVDPEVVLNDLKFFIDNDYLKQARLVEENKMVILDNRSYKEYKDYVEELDKSSDSEYIDPMYVSKLSFYKNTLPEPMSGYASEVLEIISKFSSNIDQDSKNDSYEKFKNYYIPETLNLFYQYYNIDKFKLKTDDDIEIEREIESSLEEIIEGLKRLLEATFEMNYINIKSDISVLKSMLKNDGYIGEDFK